MLNKTFDPVSLENSIYEKWEQEKAFACDSQSSKPSFCIMMPPPNVTGTLHMGHALNYTLQDILARYKRMQGFDVLWQPGTDHAGIATQAVVERQLDQQKLNRRDMGRENFLERVWEWKEKSGNIIVDQQRRLGLSPDWSRQRFTMDEGLSRAVRRAFVSLYREGLIYRAKRLVNWDPKLLTAISDLEVKSVEKAGHYWYFRYPLADKPDTFITIATSRPETLLGDTAIAVHPEDERYQHLIGQKVIVPIVNRIIPIVADTYSDPEKGTGAVKITPAHDFNDFEVGKRHNLEAINIFTPDAHLNENVPKEYQGLERFAARDKVIADMQTLNLLDKVEATTMTLPYGERSDVVIEPYLTDQWFVHTDEMATAALQAVKDGQTQLLPQSAKAVYDHWLNNIQPWCISRQLWWGHRIPTWFTPDNEIVVAETEDEAYQIARSQYGNDIVLRQDEDVLDTWFSSGLWPFSTLGWPDKTPELDRYFPSSVLITGNDILFFWVVRMMMMSLKFMGDIPFKTVYLHALVRDDQGQKMSKSKGNIIDPLDIISEYGADALRFTMSALAAPGRDIKFSRQTVAGYRNFATKIWNAARFIEHYQCQYPKNFDPQSLKVISNRWIVSELSIVTEKVSQAIESYSFDDAANLLYQFVWTRFCDWFLEFSKPFLSGPEGHEKAETQSTVAWVMGKICHLLHPFMPFITEELWKYLTDGKDGLVMQKAWPVLQGCIDQKAMDEMSWLIETITAIRSLRNEFNITPSTPLSIFLGEGKGDHAILLHIYAPLLEKIARTKALHPSEIARNNPAVSCAQIVVEGSTFMIPLGEVLDLEAERGRLTKALQDANKEIEQLQSKLNNEAFTSKAPADIIEKNQLRLKESLEAQEKLRNALTRIGSF